ncbi:hypothetical protein M433DRAFT_10068 [Acidomyces richmondensis BFW]|nr:hypothetical protein M433DRAFT_10068 [Acidomyces richmondensis BFW]
MNANLEQVELDPELKGTKQSTLLDQDTLEKKRALFNLFHRRFAHIGAEKLRSLHKVTTLEQPVPIFLDKDCPCYLFQETLAIPIGFKRPGT